MRIRQDGKSSRLLVLLTLVLPLALLVLSGCVSLAKPSYLDATHILEGTVTALYGDYRQQGEQKAVVGMHIVLIEDNSTRTAIVFQRDYHQMVELTEPSPDELTRGWNEGLRQIFMALEEDLRRVDLKAHNQKPVSER